MLSLNLILSFYEMQRVSFIRREFSFFCEVSKCGALFTPRELLVLWNAATLSVLTFSKILSSSKNSSLFDSIVIKTCKSRMPASSNDIQRNGNFNRWVEELTTIELQSLVSSRLIIRNEWKQILRTIELEKLWNKSTSNLWNMWIS